MLRALVVAIAVAASVQGVSAEPAPQPLPRICRADDPGLRCIGPFYAVGSDPTIVYLTGDIWDDAPAHFLRIMREFPKADLLVLRSAGGYIDPALIIAREVRKRGMKTYVRPADYCNSACAYIFLAGAERKADGKLGVHQVGNEKRDAVTAQQGFADVFTAMREFGVSDGVISLMLTTPPDEMHYLSRDEMASLGIEAGDPLAVPLATSTISAAQSLLLEASDDGTTGAMPFEGSIEWRQGRDERGSPTIAATVQIPARNLGAEILIRRNDDKSIPAPILIEVNFRISDSFIGGSVAGLPGVLLKDQELVQGEPLIGASARVVGNSFLFALSQEPEDQKSNNRLLSSRKWIDLALIYATGKRAIITLQKDAKAEAMFKAVMGEWPAVPKSNLLPLMQAAPR